EGLSCVVVGAAAGLADDLAVYLRHADAAVERASDLEDAAAQSASGSGLSIWVIDAGDEPPSVKQVRAAAAACPGQDIRFVIVHMASTMRYRTRAVALDMITLEGNALTRGAFLKAVAVAAGRAS